MEAGKMIYRTGRKKHAFTLVEMLVVLAIIGMLLGISIPFTTGFGKGLRLKTAARAILSTLRVAKSNAITYRDKYSVIFDVNNKEYWIEDPEGKIFERKSRLPASIEFKSQGQEAHDPVTFDGDKVVFYSTGSTKGDSGSITISDRQGNSRTISIIGSTGNIRVE